MSSRSDVSALDVQILVWPQDADRLETLRAAGHPRLVLVPPTELAPVLDDDLEDWVRLPVDDQELELRSRRLARLAREHVQLHCADRIPTDAGPDTTSSGCSTTPRVP